MWKPCCKKQAALVVAQVADIVRLQAELDTHIADGDEYHAEQTRSDIAAASSLARLVHKHPCARTEHNTPLFTT